MTKIKNTGIQHLYVFLLVSLTSGSLFCWVVLENHFEQYNMPGKKYNGYGFMTCLLTFVITGTVMHMKLLSLILQKMKFMASIYMGVALFITGLILIVIGAMYIPELLFAAEILISYAGCQIYVSIFCLFPVFKQFAVIVSCAFAVSTMMLQIVDLPIPFYVSFVVWIVLLLFTTIFFRPNEPVQIFAHSAKLEKMKDVFKYTELYPVYLNVLFGMAAKSYYQNGFFKRLQELNIQPDNLQYFFTVSNFSSILAGLTNFLPLEWSHLFNVFISIVFNVLVLTYQNKVTVLLNLFLMNISLTGVVTSAKCLCNSVSNLFESNSLNYVAMFIGDMIGLISGVSISTQTADLIVVLPSAVMQILNCVLLLVAQRKRLFKSLKPKEDSEKDQLLEKEDP
ncbi:Conserved_hypothetical protein [Hexamita inflata]|uniref:Uncharacterized protein n=1 Tax=Hexamita inflata TaxID=28002 RepID=A0AA86UR07_9EUKA|nr:Conserved hypothetical protein [Hexamita inflata]